MTACYILDIDGTLMPSVESDNRCYWQAVGDVFAVTSHAREIQGFDHVTDQGIIEQWHQEKFGSPPTAAALAELKQRFLQLLQQAAYDQPQNFEATRGLARWLQQCQRLNLPLAIATGGWRDCARFKLSLLGARLEQIPLASSDDAVSRPDIMMTALSRLLTDPATSPIYVGDGHWDLQAARHLGWGFVGIATGERAHSLTQAGADFVYSSFRPLLKEKECGIA